MSEVQRFFAGRTILLTGVTGFLGKALLEKILRCLPQVRRVYVLIRPKARGEGRLGAQQRLEKEVLASTLFHRLRQKHGRGWEAFVAERVVAVEGDLSQEWLGLGREEAQRLAQEVDIILNSAAVVSFDERLDLSLELNTLGVKRLMAFAHLGEREGPEGPWPIVLHVSTCYVCGRRRGYIPEEVPPLPFDPEKEVEHLLAQCEALRQRWRHQPRLLQKKLVELGLRRARQRGWNDTYTFTKALGEQMAVKHRGGLTTIILRPAIIESAFAEPEPGWIDGFRMCDPLFIGYGLGHIEDFPGRRETIVDIVPCDFVVNAILASLPRAAREGGLQVYQVATGETNPLCFGGIYDIGRDYFLSHPLQEGRKAALPEWTFPDLKTFWRRWRWRREIPLALALTLLRPLRWLPPLRHWHSALRSLGSRLKRLGYYVHIYSPYTFLEARFETRRMEELWRSLSPEDRRVFPFDPKVLDWRDYIANVHIPGLKRHVLRLAEEPGEGILPLHTLPDLLLRSAQRFPNKVALQMRREGKWERYTYAEVLERVKRMAGQLRAQGLSAGRRALLYAENRPEWGMAYLAAVATGATVVPVDRQWRPGDVEELARFTEAEAILTTPAGWESLRLGTLGVPLLDITNLCRPFEGAQEPAPPLEPGEWAKDAEAVASIIFTSGLGVEPRGVMLTHHNFLANVMGIVQLLPPRAEDSFLSVLPLHHALEFTAGFLIPLYAGATITYVETMRSRVLLETMREAGVTAIIGVPRLYQLLYDALRQQVAERGRWASLAFRLLLALSRWATRRLGWRLGPRLFAFLHRELGGKLRVLVSGGAALPPKIFEALTALGFELCEGYGMTEAAPVISANPIGRAKGSSVGLPLPTVEVRLENPDEKGVGEIVVRGPNITPGYFRNASATERALRDGWLFTGDLGSFDEEGYLYLAGRIKDIIVTPAGKNLYPRELERLYGDLPHLREICVVGVWEESLGGEAAHAIVVPDYTDVEPERREEVKAALYQALQERARELPTYQRFHRIHFIEEELPKWPSGEVDRRRVRAMIQEAQRGRLPLVERAPLGPEGLEREVLEAVANLLGRPREGLRLTMHLEQELGMDSLLKVELLLNLETRLRTTLPEGDLGALTTLGEVVEWVRRGLQKRPLSEVEVDLWQVRWEAEARRYLREGLLLRWARRLTRRLLGFLYRRWFQLEVHGLEHVPETGPFLIAANHASHLDTGAVLAALGLRAPELGVLGARDYFFNRPWKGWLVHTFLHVVPFDRTLNVLEGLRLARRMLQAGRPLLIFPEGTRSLTGRLQTFKPGLGLLAAEAEAPVVPAYIQGTFEAMPKGRLWPRRRKVSVTFGPPIVVNRGEALAQGLNPDEFYRRLTEEVRAAIEELAQAREVA